MKKQLLIASDHNGKKLKDIIINKFKNQFHFIDFGNYEDKEKVDYTDFAKQVAINISKNPDLYKWILICGTGAGMSIASNKYKNIRSILAHNNLTAEMSRRHNNTNVICLSSWVNTNLQNINILKIWLSSKFDAGRHVKRVDKIEKNKSKIVLVNGVFDILHTGHIDLLEHAKRLGKKLVVAINSDKSTKIIKGKKRPINSEYLRKRTLLSLSIVDEVVVFNETNLSKVIRLVKPDLLVRGADYPEKIVRIRDKVPNSVKIKIIKKTKGYSTSLTIKKMLKK